MKVKRDSFFVKEETSMGAFYVSTIEVEVSGKLFTVKRTMTEKEYDDSYPMLRQHAHNILKRNILNQIGVELFGAVEIK